MATNLSAAESDQMVWRPDAFGVSAVASYVIVDSGLLRNAERANLGTFVGALCFLVGAFLLLPERTRERQPAV